jgi:hypothetical protein
LPEAADTSFSGNSTIDFVSREKAPIMSTSAISAAIPISQPARTQTKGSAAIASAQPKSTAQNASAATAAISAATAALVEAAETSTQTAKEASGGDRQAQILLAKDAAAAAARSGGPSSKLQAPTQAVASRPGSLINERA